MLPERGGWRQRWVVAFLHSRVGRAWRCIATIKVFALFGLVSLVGGFTIMPLVPLLSLGKRDRSSFRAQKLISWWFRQFIHLLAGLGLMSYRIDAQQQLQHPGQIVIANHPTLMDTVFLIGMIPHATCVVSARFSRKWATRANVSVAGYISNDQPKALVQECVNALRAGHSLLIYPEGTRSRQGQIFTALRGAANIAWRLFESKQADAEHAAIEPAEPATRATIKPTTEPTSEPTIEFQPVFITCQPLVLSKQMPWWFAPAERPHFELRVMPPLQIEPPNSQTTPQITSETAEVAPLTAAQQVRHINQEIESYFRALLTDSTNSKLC